jgi:hypothetical protein
MTNKKLSAPRHASTAATTAGPASMRCDATSAPTAMSIGAAGSGTPSCESSTHTNTAAYPWLRTNSVPEPMPGMWSLFAFLAVEPSANSRQIAVNADNGPRFARRARAVRLDSLRGAHEALGDHALVDAQELPHDSGVLESFGDLAGARTSGLTHPCVCVRGHP